MAFLISVICSALIPVTAGGLLLSRLMVVAGAAASSRSFAGAAAAALGAFADGARSADTVLACSPESAAWRTLSETAVLALTMLPAKPNPVALLAAVPVALADAVPEGNGPPARLDAALLTVGPPTVLPFAPPASASNSSSDASRPALIKRNNPISRCTRGSIFR